jgi:hypothetical protein
VNDGFLRIFGGAGVIEGLYTPKINFCAQFLFFALNFQTLDSKKTE